MEIGSSCQSGKVLAAQPQMEMLGGASHEIWSYIKYSNTNTQIHKHKCKNTTNAHENMSNIEMVGGPSHET